MESVNYYNYLTEVEEFFVSKRGAPMLISPLDWALVESWQKMGIPLHIVLRGINKSFEGSNVDNKLNKRVNTLFYCQQQVLSNFKDYVESQVGGSSINLLPSSDNVNNIAKDTANKNTTKKENEAENFHKQQILGYLKECCEELEQPQAHATQQGLQILSETLYRVKDKLKELIKKLENTSVIDIENLERDLTLLEEMMYFSLRKDLSAQEFSEVEKEADKQLRSHKKTMDTNIYKQTLDNFVSKRLRERYFIPRLSLFYMI